MEGPVEKWTRDEIPVRKWLDKMEDSVESDKPGSVPEVNWKVFPMLRNEGRQAPRSDELHNETSAKADLRSGRKKDGKKPTKDK